MKKSLLFSLIGILAVLAALLVAGRSWAEPAIPGESELLASNTVLARFTGVQEHPCRFMTALCPNHCDHATRLASFEVLENLAYEKPGKYGDDKLSPGDTAVVDVQKPVPGQSPHVAQLISALKPGDVVRLTIRHYYIKQGQGQFPARPAVLLESAE